MMNPEGGREVNPDEARIAATVSNIRAGIDTELAVPSETFVYEVRNGKITVTDPKTGRVIEGLTELDDEPGEDL